MSYKRKTAQSRKNYEVCFHAEKNEMFTEKKDKKVNRHKKSTESQNTRTQSILFWISEMLLKFIIVFIFHLGS